MKKFCTACGNVGEPNHSRRGSGGIEFVLWMFMFLPGIIYSIWRSSGDDSVCPACGSRQVIPVESPMARKLMGDDYQKMKDQEAENAKQRKYVEDQEGRRRSKECAAEMVRLTRELAKPWIKREGNLTGVIIAVVALVALAIGIPWIPYYEIKISEANEAKEQANQAHEADKAKA